MRLHYQQEINDQIMVLMVVINNSKQQLMVLLPIKTVLNHYQSVATTVDHFLSFMIES